MKSAALKIKNSRGYELNAFLEMPIDQHPRAYAIFAHCFTCSSNLNAVRNVSRALTASGFAVLRFDFTGLGGSEGSLNESSFSANLRDLVDVSDYLTTNYEAPKLIVGHSLGGAAALVAASEIDSIKAVATIGAPSHVDHVTQHFMDQTVEGAELFEVNIGGRPFTISHDFVNDFRKVVLTDVVHQMKKPLLVLHSPADNTVGIENAQEIYTSAFHPKSFVSLDGADHLLSDRADSSYAGEVIGTWVRRYFPEDEKSKLGEFEGQVAAHLNLIKDQFTTEIKTQKHSIIADEPDDVGGDDYGPSPFDLLSSSVAACTAMTLKMYVARKKWALEEIFVYVTHSKKHVPEEGKSIDHMEVSLSFVGELSEEEEGRLLDIAKKCPVHKTLVNGVNFAVKKK
jgi:putative redox protein